MSLDVEINILHNIIYKPNQEVFKQVTALLHIHTSNKHIPNLNIVGKVSKPLISLRNCTNNIINGKI
jgi:hypothetical protein